MVCRFHPGGPRLVSSRQIRCAACSLAPPEDFWAAPRSLASKKNTAVFYFFTGLCLPRWREEAAVFIPSTSTPPHVVSNIRAPRGTHMFWWNTPVNCRRMRSKGGETHDLHVMVAIAEIAGLKSPARAAAMASFSALASTQVVVLGIIVALVLIVIHRQTRRTTSAGGRPQESFGHHHRPRCRGGRDTVWVDR